MTKSSGSSHTSPSASCVSRNAARTISSSSGDGSVESSSSTFSGSSTSSSIAAMVPGSCDRSGMSASMNQICRRRFSSKSWRLRAFSSPTSDMALFSGLAPKAPAASAKRVSSSSVSNWAPFSWIFSQMVSSPPLSTLMGVQKSFFSGIFGLTSALRGSEAPLPGGAPPFFGGGPPFDGGPAPFLGGAGAASPFFSGGGLASDVLPGSFSGLLGAAGGSAGLFGFAGTGDGRH
mmetsp:Transcript_408/g.1022  ORF Transcript_408/g.1022 Transcript_408/m.1022 type:complete len:233 (-) Transcript_408:874-1572(-)